MKDQPEVVVITGRPACDRARVCGTRRAYLLDSTRARWTGSRAAGSRSRWRARACAFARCRRRRGGRDGGIWRDRCLGEQRHGQRVFAGQGMTAEEFRRVTEVTYLGVAHGTLAALKRMLPRDRGTSVQVGSALISQHPIAGRLLRGQARQARFHRFIARPSTGLRIKGAVKSLSGCRRRKRFSGIKSSPDYSTIVWPMPRTTSSKRTSPKIQNGHTT